MEKWRYDFYTPKDIKKKDKLKEGYARKKRIKK